MDAKQAWNEAEAILSAHTDYVALREAVTTSLLNAYSKGRTDAFERVGALIRGRPDTN